MSLSRTILLSSLVLCLASGPALAQDAKAAADANAKMQDAMQTAVTKGIRWLTGKQIPSGEWIYDNKPLQLPGKYPMTSGVTALCAFALMKCGIGPNEEVIRKAFAVIHKEGFTYTYEVGCILLALEAKINFDPNRQPVQAPGAINAGAGSRTRAPAAKKKKKKRKKAKRDPRDRKLAKACVDWLVEHQRETGLWRYSAGDSEDISNAQYAMLGLNAAERMGIKVPKLVYAKAAKRLVEMQCEVSSKDKDAVIKPFPVPGADSSFKNLKKIEAKLLREMKQVKSRFRKLKPDERDKKGFTKDEAFATAERKAAETITSLTEKRKMIPRGWMYFAPDVAGNVWQKTVTGSLTVSAMASLFICKAQLEGTPMWTARLRGQVKDALRNGAAWMSLHFAVNRNPGEGIHQLYYLYGLERAGVLGLVHRFGAHEWFDKGARHLVGQQKRDGSWRGSGSTAGLVPDTCFALLFLSRGTTPVVKLPSRVMTGVNR